MIQTVSWVRQFISFGNKNTYWPILAGDAELSTTFGLDAPKIPLPWATTARNLSIYSRDTRTEAVSVTLLKNGVATALSVTLPAASDGPVVTTGIDVAFSQFDDISYRATTANAQSGWTISVSLELESAGNVFGLTGDAGGFDVNHGGIGGAFGNGLFQAYDHALPDPSGTYSICASPGNVTTLALKAYSGSVPVGSTWTAWIYLNDVLQDGNGGTVNTTCVMAAGNTTAVSTFTLPVVKGDHVEVAYIRTGANAPFALIQVAAGVGFVPTNASYFMFCGGSNILIPVPTAYKWNASEQNLTTEPLAESIVGPSGLILRGKYVERAPGPGTGKTMTHTTRKNEADTSIVVTLLDAETTGLIEGMTVNYNSGDRIDIQVIATAGAPTTSQFHWGLEATVQGVVDEPGPVPPGVIGPHIWVIFPRTQPDDLGSP